MKFSIVVPTYNRVDFIAKTINSILKQSYTNFEILVVDDGSTDNTKEVVENINDPRVFYFKKENAERGAARNFGANKATGDFITFLDSDDLLLEDYFKKANEYILSNNPSIFFQLFEIRDYEGSLLKKAISHPNNISQALVNKGNIFACQGAFIKTEVFLSYRFIEDRKMAGSEDYELWLRMNANEKVLCNPVVTSVLVEHDERSVLGFNTEQLIERKELMLYYLFNNETVNSYYLNSKNKIKSNTYSYISLHILLAGKKKKAIKYLFKAIKSKPSFIFSKRFLAIIKRLL